MIRDRYLLLVLILSGLMAFCSTTGTWGGDFWSHAAAVREVSLRPFHPRHPEVATDLPGLFFTPYAVAVAWLARVARVSAITALAVAGMCNLVLVLVALRVYVGTLCRRTTQAHALAGAPSPGAGDRVTRGWHLSRHPGLVAFYTVVFVLFLWGPSPWKWSGFFHLPVLPAVLPYPSTFATALSLGALALHLRWLTDRSTRLWSLCAVTAVLPLTHPMTAVACGVGLVAQALGIRSERSWNDRAVAFGAIAVVAAGVAWLWPYYPFFAAIGRSEEYHEAHAEMYANVWRPIWPAVVALPCLAWRLRGNTRDPVALGFVGVACLYLYGGLTGALAYGRVLSHAVMAAHVSLAAWVADSEMRHATGRPLSRTRIAGLLIISAVFAVAVYGNAIEIRAALLDRADTVRSYQFLPRYVGRDDVVLSDLANSYPVPAFAGKVVSHVGNLTLVPDAAERTRAVERFFDDTASTGERLEIIRKYDVRWLLLDRTHPNSEQIARVHSPPGGAVFEDDHWILIQLDHTRLDR